MKLKENMLIRSIRGQDTGETYLITKVTKHYIYFIGKRIRGATPRHEFLNDFEIMEGTQQWKEKFISGLSSKGLQKYLLK